MRWVAVVAGLLSSRPHRQAPTTSDWPGRCGPARPWCAASTLRRPTGTAATAAWTWPARSISRCTPRGRRQWCSPGVLAGRPVVSLAHSGGLRTSYEPVRAAVRVGQLVDSTTALGTLAARPSRLCGRCLPALGRDVGPGRTRRLRRPAGVVGVHPHPAQTPAPRCPRECARHLLARRCVLVRDTPLISVLLCTLAPKGRTSGVPQARGCAWSCTARSLATVTWV